ncbi:Peptidoglycan-binding protein [Weissella ceti]|uniref:Peptidoglycan-binding protein n=2 Tax=Weissella ceti TaxID=759620 RepID=A0A088GG05_9LACO|nr:Peptidoglycan-binding protein [Weissella ceti]AIM64442.1 Peptidoglycan-binding protein [Weissella ceti]
MKTSKEVALTVAGIVALLTTGQTMVHAASNVANANQADSQLTMSVNDMVVASVQNEEIKFADQNIRVSSNTSVSSDKIADATKSGADKAAEKASKLAKETAAKEDAAEAKEKEEKAEAEAKAKEEAKQAEKALAAAEKAAAEQAKEAETVAEVTTVSVEAAPAQKQASAPKASAPAGSGSVYDQFIAAGGTPEMWQTIVVLNQVVTLTQFHLLDTVDLVKPRKVGVQVQLLHKHKVCLDTHLHVMDQLTERLSSVTPTVGGNPL